MDLVEKSLHIAACSAYAAYRNTLSGTSSPSQQYYYERMSNPVIGDLVLETSSLTMNDIRPIDRIGYLKSVLMTPYPIPEYWDETTDGSWEENGLDSRDVWTIQTLDDREYTWENCRFIVVPEKPYGHQGDIR